MAGQWTIWAEKGGQFSLFEHIFCTSQQHLDSESHLSRRASIFPTNHHGHPPSLAFRNMNQAQQQYGGQKQYMYNASMTLKNQGNDHIKAIRERCEPLKGKLPWKFMEHSFIYIIFIICYNLFFVGKILGGRIFFFIFSECSAGGRWRSQLAQAQKYADALKAYSKALDNLKPFGGDDARRFGTETGWGDWFLGRQLKGCWELGHSCGSGRKTWMFFMWDVKKLMKTEAENCGMTKAARYSWQASRIVMRCHEMK